MPEPAQLDHRVLSIPHTRVSVCVCVCVFVSGCGRGGGEVLRDGLWAL